MSEAHPIDPDLAVQVCHLNVHLGGQHILQDVCLDIPKGKVVALIGPNGSGKTTLIKTIVGLVKRTSGDIRIFGQCILDKVRPRIGYVPQKINFDRGFALSVREFLHLNHPHCGNFLFGNRSCHMDTEIIESIPELQLEKLLDKPVAGLSGGQMQRMLIAFSLAKNPDLLLLDEPTAGVDTPGEQSFYELIARIHKRHQMTVVLVSHDLSMVYKHAHLIHALNGKICCSGTPEDVINTESLKEAYGAHVSPYEHHHHHHHTSTD